MSSYQVLSGGLFSKAVKRTVQRTLALPAKKTGGIAAPAIKAARTAVSQPPIGMPPPPSGYTPPGYTPPSFTFPSFQYPELLSQPTVTTPPVSETVAEVTQEVNTPKKAGVPMVLLLGIGFMAFKLVLPMLGKKGRK
jgi:hypothetical protein